MAVRVIYFYDLKTLEYVGSNIIFDDRAELPTSYTTDDGVKCGVTTIRPADGLYTPRHFDIDKQAWIGTDKEKWLAAHPAPVPVPTAEQQMIMQQASDITQLKQLAMAQASQLATQSKGSAE